METLLHLNLTPPKEKRRPVDQVDVDYVSFSFLKVTVFILNLHFKVSGRPTGWE